MRRTDHLLSAGGMNGTGPRAIVLAVAARQLAVEAVETFFSVKPVRITSLNFGITPQRQTPAGQSRVFDVYGSCPASIALKGAWPCHD